MKAINARPWRLGDCFVALTSSALLAMTVLLSFCFAADEQSPSVLFYKGNMAYEKAQYDEAVADYQNALSSGFESGNLYYNLANAYFKKGELGRAILNYKRAGRLMPQDSDLKANMEYAQSAVEQPVSQKPNLFVRFATNAVRDLDIDSLTMFLIVLYAAIFLLAAALLFLKSVQRPAKALLLLCCLVFFIGTAGFFIKIDQKNQPWAVVLDKEIDVRYEPFESATAYFKVFQGYDALLLKIKGDWAFIKRPDGKAGWIKASSIEKI